MSLPGGRIAGVDRARGGDKQKIVKSACRPAIPPAPAHRRAGQGLRSLNESQGQYFAPAADSRFCTASFSSRPVLSVDGLQHPANPRQAQNFSVSLREVALMDAFAFESQHRVGPTVTLPSIMRVR